MSSRRDSAKGNFLGYVHGPDQDQADGNDEKKRAFPENCPLKGLVIVSCTCRVDEILQKAISLDMLMDQIKIKQMEMMK
jgi:hypothetical protein